jgi:hypothetical protein
MRPSSWAGAARAVEGYTCGVEGRSFSEGPTTGDHAPGPCPCQDLPDLDTSGARLHLSGFAVKGVLAAKVGARFWMMGTGPPARA